MSKSKRYKIRSQLFTHGFRTYEVVDTTTGKTVSASIFESRAIKERNRLNKIEAALPGGFNKRQAT